MKKERWLMTAKKDLLKEFQELVKRMPENEVRAALAREGVGETNIRLLLGGEYKSKPGPMLRRALAAVLNMAS